ncbi:zinc knuckle domain-containing protein [Toxoplasma gondii RUB]|uniref:Zinc knuckle domain-containing protein n=1 Tax=Toxoplasma gondii RUB TaxID=935652 RepID=A0A086M7C6_TOXGO|nr:zinc knuckle domain-containing protein [Toxoplasma gondii RUB]
MARTLSGSCDSARHFPFATGNGNKKRRRQSEIDTPSDPKSTDDASAADGVRLKKKCVGRRTNEKTHRSASPKGASRKSESGRRKEKQLTSHDNDSQGEENEGDFPQAAEGRDSDVADLGNDDQSVTSEEADAAGSAGVKDKPVMRKKRKRRECWTIEQVRERMAELVSELENRSEMTKSRQKRLRARLALLAKAERGEIKVGGQLEKSKKKLKAAQQAKQGGKGKSKNLASKHDSTKGTQKPHLASKKLTGSQKKKLNKICLRCREKGHVLENCPLAQSSATGSSAAENVAKQSDAKAGPLMSGICFNCGATDHTLKNCKKKRKPHGALPFALCFICGEKGHLSSGCPKSKTGKYPQGGSCHTCGSIYHLQIECPEFQRQQKERSNQEKQSRAKGNSRGRTESRNENKQKMQTTERGSATGGKVHRKIQEPDPDEFWMGQSA